MHYEAAAMAQDAKARAARVPPCRFRLPAVCCGVTKQEPTRGRRLLDAAAQSDSHGRPLTRRSPRRHPQTRPPPYSRQDRAHRAPMASHENHAAVGPSVAESDDSRRAKATTRPGTQDCGRQRRPRFGMVGMLMSKAASRSGQDDHHQFRFDLRAGKAWDECESHLARHQHDGSRKPSRWAAAARPL